MPRQDHDLSDQTQADQTANLALLNRAEEAIMNGSGRPTQQHAPAHYRSVRVGSCSDQELALFGDVLTRLQVPRGRLLWRTSLDELPQLLNVLKSDMSLVGPRARPGS